MLRLLKNASLVLLWLVLCVLTVSGCQATAPTAVLYELGTATEIAERSFLENLHLFVRTDYGEFCALLACAAAAEVSLLLRRYALPWLSRHAPRLFAYLKGAYTRLLALMKKQGFTPPVSMEPIDVPSSFDEDDEDSDGTPENTPSADGDAASNG